MIRILLVDDHPVVRHGIRTILMERLRGAVVGEAANAETALRQVAAGGWDVVVADISLPGMSGLDLLKDLQRLHPSLPTLVLSMHPAAQFARRALKAGAAGYLTKDSAPEELIAAIEDARRGRRYVGRDAGDVLMRWAAKSVTTPHEALSDREYQLLRMIGSGQTVSDVARDLGLSVKTVSTYRARVLEKLGMRTNAELMRYAIENNLLDS
ncbi:MAG TPA: response regulator transcription factor [Vicinamibacterales bacterium]|jgi:DNA-binding NarL/FixJ family response regulator|nr:response regulator transcription factor [Vicinamibacterales bacterium]